MMILTRSHSGILKLSTHQAARALKRIAMLEDAIKSLQEAPSDTTL